MASNGRLAVGFRLSPIYSDHRRGIDRSPIPPSKSLKTKIIDNVPLFVNPNDAPNPKRTIVFPLNAPKLFAGGQCTATTAILVRLTGQTCRFDFYVVHAIKPVRVIEGPGDSHTKWFG
jgi:hypothetical protein